MAGLRQDSKIICINDAPVTRDSGSNVQSFGRLLRKSFQILHLLKEIYIEPLCNSSVISC